MIDDNDIKDDPDAPAFERDMMCEPEPDVIEKIAPDRELITAVQARFSELVTTIVKDTDDVMYLEMLIALANTFVGLAEKMIHACEFEVFVENRDCVLGLIGVMSGMVNTTKPTMEQLAEAPVTETVH